MGTVRSSHLCDGVSGSTDPVLIYTAPAGAVPVIKGIYLSTDGTVNAFPASAFLYCQRSGGAAPILQSAIGPGYQVVYGGTCWVVLDEGDELYLVGDGLQTWTVTVDGALLVDTP